MYKRDYEMLGEIPALIGDINTSRFFDTLLDLIARVFSFDIAEVLMFSTRSAPEYLMSRERRAWMATMTRPYAEIYTQDPLFHAFRDRLPPGLYNPERLLRRYPNTTFFDTFYRDVNSGEEMEFLVPYEDGRAAVIWFCRSEPSNPRSVSRLSELEALEPILRACVQKHLSCVSSRRDKPIPRFDRDAAFSALSWRALTRRETEIARRMLLGDSAKETGARLHIAEGTVRIHRKNIYRKLNIGSLAELFALCSI
jgi:DNA-binding CsgD family transcriptional regulator